MRDRLLCATLLALCMHPGNAGAASDGFGSIPDLRAKGMKVLSDAEVLREFPGSTFEVAVEDRGVVLVEHFALNGQRRIAPVPGSPVRARMEGWRVEGGRLCAPATGSPVECGAPIGRMGETFYRLSADRV
ncbi:hypothetical protein ACFPYM_05135, partial [Methylobacterium hispanicum]